ncbi:hypothetical protein [Shewanella sp.]|jgi:hypothetical protein|uniref:hypothetical protein n=1 Tax=Shewanella sp. TaxID=50422 RepID=UPI003562E35A
MNDLSKYNAVKDSMKTGDVLQWHSNSMLGSAIRARKGGDINHTGLVIRLAEFEGLERRRFTLESLENGVVLNLLSRRLESFDGQVFLHRLKPEHDSIRQEIGERALSCVGIGYDYSSIIKECFGNAQMNMDNLFCSEFAWFAETGKTVGEAPDPNEFEEYLQQWFIEPHIPLL